MKKYSKKGGRAKKKAIRPPHRGKYKGKTEKFSCQTLASGSKGNYA